MKMYVIKCLTCYYFYDIIKIEDFHFTNILIDDQSYENVLVFNISNKVLIGSIKYKNLLEFMMNLDI